MCDILAELCITNCYNENLTIIKIKDTIKIGDNMIIMFVRHAEAIKDEITTLGKKQCELMCEQNEDYKFTKIYCSSVKRCKETAKYLQEKYNLEIEYLNNIRDRETLEKEPVNQSERDWYNNYLNKTFSHSNPEGCKEFLQRNFAEFDKIISMHKNANENIILVAHSCTFYALQEYLNPSEDDNLNYCRLANCSKVYFEVI